MLVSPKLHTVWLRVNGVAHYLDPGDILLLLRCWRKEAAGKDKILVYEFLTHTGTIGTLTTTTGLGYYFNPILLPEPSVD